MKCPNITGLKLDNDDWEAIEDIRRRQRAGNMLEVVMPAGVLATIFLGNNSAQATFNVSGFDFVLFTKAMSHAGDIVRKSIEKEARMQYFSPGKSYEQRQFWKAIYSSCTGGV